MWRSHRPWRRTHSTSSSLPPTGWCKVCVGMFVRVCICMDVQICVGVCAACPIGSCKVVDWDVHDVAFDNLRKGSGQTMGWVGHTPTNTHHPTTTSPETAIGDEVQIVHRFDPPSPQSLHLTPHPQHSPCIPTPGFTYLSISDIRQSTSHPPTAPRACSCNPDPSIFQYQTSTTRSKSCTASSPTRTRKSSPSSSRWCPPMWTTPAWCSASGTRWYALYWSCVIVMDLPPTQH